MAATLLLGAHCDDLAFSLGGALLDGRFGALQPLVVYTVSNCSRRHAPTAVTTISNRRTTEERRFFRRVPAAAAPLCLGHLDAPLRFGIEPTQTRTLSLPVDAEAASVAAAIEKLPLADGRLLAPLALGDHIDHRAVCAAALRLRHGRDLYFYEDLPYAGEIEPAAILRTLAALAAELDGALQPLLLPSPSVLPARQWAVRCYRSQIGPEDLPWLLAHPRRLGTGELPVERIWHYVPNGGKEQR